ncbi:hypothetical protein CFE53_01430 [Methanofervidicoccus sp. A16]|uniref:DUF2109 domain-containing protein n=1 Tax=Methanofervidicoccus sp. A16 TaxID=2607662 RepID=UPI00118C4F79|nr:DUF2109 domain-containing protein [Methanofervidicoccus sp. A16]AXI24892.1 hypothetical protein CFE53_01430 [Methanofervidicoccus sp. A16]
MDIVMLMIGVISFVVGIRIFLTKNKVQRLLYLCCLNFAISALIALYVGSPMGGVVAVVYFVGSTLSSNAIAHTIGKIQRIEGKR